LKTGGRKVKLHSDERVLLFLSEFSTKKELWDVPIEVTQKGISKRLGMLENNVSRSLKRISGDGLVDSDLKHVKGEKRRQKAYFLTGRGEAIVEKLKEGMAKTYIEVSADGEITKMPLPRAYRMAREMGISLTLAELYILRTKMEHPLDLTPGWETTRDGPTLIGNYQMPLHFFGREKELGDVEKFLRSRAGVMIIWGLAGMGKTSLILKGVSDSMVKAGYIRCEPWTDRIELVNEISWVLSQMGFEDDAAELLKDDISPGQLSRKIRNVTSSAKGLTLIIDDLQKTGGGLDIYMEGICKASMETPGLKVIILTRERPSFLDPRFEIHGDVRSLELKGLDLKSVAMMIKEAGKGGDIGAVWDITKGHPLFVELMLTSLGLSARSRFGEFLDQEILAPLPPQQKKALELTALSGLPVHRSLIVRTSAEDIDYLQRKGLFREVKGGLLYVHDIISDHLKATVPGDERKNLLDEILAYQLAVILRIWGDGAELLSQETMKELGAPKAVTNLIREQYSKYVYEDIPPLRDQFKRYLDTTISRFLEMGDLALAINTIFVLNRTSGVGRGKALLGPILKLERARPTEEQMFHLRLQKAKIESIEGDLESASRTLDLIEATYPKKKIKGSDLALMQHVKGKVSRSQKRYHQMLKAHQKAIEAYDKIGDKKGVAKERLHLAKALHQMGDAPSAFKEAIKSASEYEKALDRRGEVYACLQAYRSSLDLGKEEQAEKCLKRSRSVARSINDNRLLALIKMEETILSKDLPDKRSIDNLKKICSQVAVEDRDMVVRGYLSIAQQFEDARSWKEKDLRLSCLKPAWNLLYSVDSEDDGASSKTTDEGLTNMIDLLEQLLSLNDEMSDKELKKAVDEVGYPFFPKKDQDHQEVLLERLAGSYKKLADSLHVTMIETGGNPGQFDNAAEGRLHTLLTLGIYFQKKGKRKKARGFYKECKAAIEEHERRSLKIVDHVTSFNLRKVKEVLEENRSALEGIGF
jgi:tetratricopeptide (TPR) repeat protein/DNA-binding MarR family transcriptional regulator